MHKDTSLAEELKAIIQRGVRSDADPQIVMLVHAGEDTAWVQLEHRRKDQHSIFTLQAADPYPEGFSAEQRSYLTDSGWDVPREGPAELEVPDAAGLTELTVDRLLGALVAVYGEDTDGLEWYEL